eukprot:6754762-Pyramimonas_sp.AAC.3
MCVRSESESSRLQETMLRYTNRIEARAGVVMVGPTTEDLLRETGFPIPLSRLHHPSYEG